MSLKRPSAKETDDDLLRMQEEFLSCRAEGSRQDAKSELPGTAKRVPVSRFKSRRRNIEEREPVPKLVDNHDLAINTIIINDIMERDMTRTEVKAPLCMPVPFPRAMPRPREFQPQEGDFKRSIFSQHMELMQAGSCYMHRKQAAPLRGSGMSEAAQLPCSGSTVVDGSGLGKAEGRGEALKIHQENLAKLATMSEDEIKTEQQQLLSQLDPKIVDFLRHQKPKILSATCNDKTQDLLMDVDDESNNGRISILPTVPSGSALLTSSSDAIMKAQPSHVQADTKNSSYLNHADTLPLMETKLDKDRAAIVETPQPNSKKDELDYDISELPIHPKEAERWPHMATLEKDKLAWTTMLPEPKPLDRQTSHLARFDFEGKLVSRRKDVGVQAGLHHHGEEPEAAGYTCAELFSMTRSSFQSQRAMALTTLGRIFSNVWHGLLDGCFDTPLLQQLLEAGLVSLLRRALDDSTDPVIAAAVHAIRGLIVSDPDELCLDRAFCWHFGYEMPLLKQPSSSMEFDGSKKELDDAQIAKLDVIEGFLRMDLLPRLRYILEVYRPEAAVVGHVLDILIRISRHSLEAASQVCRCPRLMDVIIMEFLTPQWDDAEVIQGKLSTVYGFPLWPAMKLVRVLASAGRHLAAKLVSEHHVMDSLLCYFAMDTCDGKLPLEEMMRLFIESWKTWKVFLSYGLTSQQYLDIFPSLVKRLQSFQSLSISHETGGHYFDYEYASAVVGVLESVVHTAVSHHTKESETGDGFFQSPVQWAHVVELPKLLEPCLFRWLWEFTKGDILPSGLTLTGSCLDFMASFCKEQIRQVSCSTVALLQNIERVCNESLIPMLQSGTLSGLLRSLCSYSMLLSDGSRRSDHHVPTLPSIQSTVEAGEAVPIVREGTPFPLLVSLSHLLVTVGTLHHGIDGKLSPLLLGNPELVRYLQQLASQKTWTYHWFARFEIRFLSYLVVLAAREKETYSLYHDISLLLIPLLHPGDEHLASDMVAAGFHAGCISEQDRTAHAILDLNLSNRIAVTSATGEIIEGLEQKLLDDSVLQMASIRATYMPFIEDLPGMEASKKRFQHQCLEVDTLSIPAAADSLLPYDWMYIPIVGLYKNDMPSEEDSSEDDMQTVTRCLQWCHLLRVWKPTSMHRVSSAASFCRLATVFLAGSKVFLDATVQSYLHSALRHLVQLGSDSSMNFEHLQIPGISSFAAFYGQLLEHFEAVSYGDHLFANFVLVPLQQSHGPYLKRELFTEHSGVLRILNIPLAEVFVPVDKFLLPVEMDPELMTLYCRSLVNGSLNHQRSPLFYLMAVHHLSNYLFVSPKDGAHSRSIVKLLMKFQGKEAVDHVLRYKAPVPSLPLGFELYNTIPEQRQFQLDTYLKHQR